MIVLVVGSTGLVGSNVALQLQRQGHQVLAFCRDGRRNPKVQPLLQAGIKLVEGDLTDPESLRAACSGVETVITTATSMPSGANDGLRRVDRDGTLSLIDAAVHQNVRRFIYTSYSGNIEEGCLLKVAKRDCEAALSASPMQTVILRPSFFMEVWLSPALGFDPVAGTVRIYGSGQEKVSYVSAFDVASFAVAAVTRRYPEEKTILEIGGPEPLSQLDATLLFEQALGKEIKMEHISLGSLQAQLQSTADPLQKTFAALTFNYAQGDIVADAVANAKAHQLNLTSVSDYASGFHARAAVVS
jgi:NADH dehydrogenase